MWGELFISKKSSKKPLCPPNPSRLQCLLGRFWAPALCFTPMYVKEPFFCACLNVNFYCLFFSFFCELGLCPSYSLFPVLFWRVSFSFSFVFTSFRCVRLLMWSVIITSCSLTQVSVEPCHHWESAHLQLSWWKALVSSTYRRWRTQIKRGLHGGVKAVGYDDQVQWTFILHTNNKNMQMIADVIKSEESTRVRVWFTGKHWS